MTGLIKRSFSLILMLSLLLFQCSWLCAMGEECESFLVALANLGLERVDSFFGHCAIFQVFGVLHCAHEKGMFVLSCSTFWGVEWSSVINY